MTEVAYLADDHQLSPVLRALCRAREGKLNQAQHQQLAAELERIAVQVRQARELWELLHDKVVEVEPPFEG